MDIPTKEESIFLKYLEEYLVKLEKENPNIKIGKIDLPGFTVFGIHESIIISKKFGFIKRLLDNDKIDFDNRDLKDRFMNEFERYPRFQNNTTNREFNINGLIMLLSISDEPISDLISYLR